MKRGEIPIYEPALDSLVRNNAESGRFSFATDLASVPEADAVFIAVGTPSRRGDGDADLSHVHAAVREIAGHLQGFTVMVTKSTVLVGTGDEAERIVRETRRPISRSPRIPNSCARARRSATSSIPTASSSAPTTSARKVVGDVYRPLYLNQVPIMYTGRRTAELIKYTVNAFRHQDHHHQRDGRSRRAVGANVQVIARGIGLDNRVGTKFLHAGPGYGGRAFRRTRAR